MTNQSQTGLDLIQRQIKELDIILQEVARHLNAVAGKERIAKWKSQTVALLAQQVGPAEAKRLADTPPGRSFSYDIVEEVSDEAEPYRNFLQALANELKARK
jgi:GGDEF domain-containing protein